MPHFKVLKSESMNGRQPQPIGTIVILSAEEAAPFVSSEVLEAIDAPAVEPGQPIAPIAQPTTPSPSVPPTEEHQ